MLIPEGLEIGIPVMVAGADNFKVVGLGSDHPGIENVGNIPASTYAGRRISNRNRILTKCSIDTTRYSLFDTLPSQQYLKMLLPQCSIHGLTLQSSKS